MDAIMRVLEWEVTAIDRSMHEAVARRYASRAVQNLLIDRFRARLTVDALGIERIYPDPDTPAWRAEGHPLEQISDRLMSELDEQQSDLLRAYFAGSEYFREESVCQGLSAGTARVKIHRMLKRLRERGRRFLSEQPK
jgi:DNA-directed RNA polymerase specialized sigma24 family protein